MEPGKRQSNIELLRLLAMMMVLGVHANYMAIGMPKISDFASSPIDSYARVFFEQACCICVDLFVIISGWFGIHPNGKKLASLLFQVFFLSVIATIIAIFLGSELCLKWYIKPFVIGQDYWFVVAYLILFVFSPVLNSFIEHSSKRQLEIFLISFYVCSTVYGFLAKDIGHFIGGYSGISFIGLYVLARYMRLYPGRWCSLNPAIDIAIYMGCTLLATGIVIIQTRFGITSVGVAQQNAYNNPLLIIGAFFFFLAFSKVSFFSRWINWLASSAFAIYLIHCHPLVFDHYVPFAGFIYNYYSGIQYWGSIVSFLLLVAFSCILIDKVRLLVWSTISKPLFKQDAKQ